MANVKSWKWPVDSFTKEINPRLAKRPLETNGRLANVVLTSLLKEATSRVWYNIIQKQCHPG